MTEGATHVEMFHDIRKSAFTLAEVLVTLGIIGVVAAMTMPMLAKNYQFFVRKQQFKKAYAELTIAMQKAQLDMGEGVRCFYRYSGVSSEGTTLVYNVHTDCPIFYNEIIKNLNIMKTCKENAKQGKCLSEDFRGADKVYAARNPDKENETAEEYYARICSGFKETHLLNSSNAYITNSGNLVIPYGNATTWDAPIFLVDINGHKGPNKWGHDIFVFEFVKAKEYDSNVLLHGTTRCHALDENGYYSRDLIKYLYGTSNNLQ